MPTPAFFAVLRDVAKLAASAADDLSAQAVKLGAAADDIAALTGKAVVKTSGVAGDDLAVGAGQVGAGVSPNRELPALWRITQGSALNKAVLSLALLLVAAYAPGVVTIALVLGALYLAYEGGEGLLERFHPHGPDEASEPQLSEDDKVKGAIRTDLVLSLEILVIALSTVPADASLEYKAAVLAAVSVIMTLGVYGLIGLLIRLDDMGLALARTGSDARKALGRLMVNAAPVILKALAPIGMVAMFAVAGGIFLHLAHYEASHWAWGLALDVGAGAAVGLLLAGAHMLLGRLRKSTESAQGD